MTDAALLVSVERAERTRREDETLPDAIERCLKAMLCERLLRKALASGDAHVSHTDGDGERCWAIGPDLSSAAA
jgi:hypothetical protein